MAIAPFLAQEGTNRPYATIAEVKTNVATSAVDFTKLVKGGSSDDQLVVLTDMLALASEKVDDYCLGPLGTMNATINMENGEFSVGRDGLIAIKPEYWPVIGVNSFAYGIAVGDQTSVPCTNQNVWIDRDSFKITQGLGGGLAIGSLSQVLGGFRAQGRVFCTYTYTSGFFNAFLTEDAAAGDTEVVVDNVIGLIPTMSKPIPIYDGLHLEQVIISPTWDGVSLTVPLTAPLAYDHATGIRFSNIPRQITQAAIHFVVGQMKERGVGGFVLQETGQSTSKAAPSGTTHRGEDENGYDLLDSFRKTWGRS